MVNLLTGQKGSGKTQQMIAAANLKAKECDGNVIFSYIQKRRRGCPQRREKQRAYRAQENGVKPPQECVADPLRTAYSSLMT